MKAFLITSIFLYALQVVVALGGLAVGAFPIKNEITPAGAVLRAVVGSAFIFWACSLLP